MHADARAEPAADEGTELFGPGVAVMFGDPRDEWPLGPAHEEAAMERAVPKRRNEFRAGRTLARRAMERLGHMPAPVHAGADRAPAWPSGLAGSISHCADLCGVALTRTGDGILSLGLDIEPAEPLEEGLFEAIATPDEAALLSGPQAGMRARMLFSAKECAYKAQYPLTKTMLDFQDFDIAFDVRAGGFEARFNRDTGRFARGDALEGRIAVGTRHILCAMTLREENTR